MLGRLVLIIMYHIMGILMDTSIQLTLIVLGVLTLLFALTVRTKKEMIRGK